MDSTLQKMQDDVEAMEKMVSNPTEVTETDVSTDMAHSDPSQTLDGMMEDVTAVDNTDDVVIAEKEAEKSKKKKRTNWKLRFSKYKTTTDATIYELRKENATYISQIQTLNSTINKLRADTVESDSTKFLDRFTDVDKEVLGEDALTSIEAATNAAVEPLKQQLAEERAWREKQLEEQRIKSKNNASTYFLNTLAEVVPDYAEIDTDPSFQKWMSESDSISGIQRLRLFKQAESTGDVARVAEFMKEYKRVSAPVDNLKDKITPTSTANASPTIIEQEGGGMSMKDINKFYDDVLKGRYRHNEKQRQEIEAKVNTALGNGDVY